MEPIISVIIPVYNVEKYIDKCIESVLSQTCQQIEVILCVGLCEDNSLERCLYWQKKNERIIVISRKDTSLGDARNYGLKVARGEYVAFVDADDYLDKEYLNELVSPLLEHPEIKISCCGIDTITEKGTIVHTWSPNIKGKRKVSCKEYIDAVVIVGVWDKLYNKKWMLEKEMWYFDGCCEDQAQHLMLAASIGEVYFIPKPLYYYRRDNASSLMHSIKSKTHLGPACAYAIHYLQKNGLYETNRLFVKDYILALMTRILEECNYEKEVVKVYEDFLNVFYPEVVAEYRVRNIYDVDLNKTLVLWGAGVELERILEKTDATKFSFIVDRNSALHGTKTKNIPIVGLDWLEENIQKCTVIVTTIKYLYEVQNQLKGYNAKDYLTGREYLKRIENYKNKK